MPSPIPLYAREGIGARCIIATEMKRIGKETEFIYVVGILEVIRTCKGTVRALIDNVKCTTYRPRAPCSQACHTEYLDTRTEFPTCRLTLPELHYRSYKVRSTCTYIHRIPRIDQLCRRSQLLSDSIVWSQI